MQSIVSLLVMAGLLVQLYAGWKLKSRLRLTSLTGAWWIWLFAWACWTGTWLCTAPFSTVSAGIADQLWYTTTVVTVSVPIAVLGARRPGHIVWLLFVLLPLILVLCWPAWLNLPRAWQGTRLSLEEPTVFGLGLVAVMGFGNYLGTRWTFAALLIFSAIAGVMVPISIWGNTLQTHSETFRTAATLANSLVAIVVIVQLRSEVRPLSRVTANVLAEADVESRLATNRPDVYNPLEVRQRVEGFNRLWFSFRDLYGLVWARRLQERINQIADRKKWPIRLEWFGWTERINERPAAHTSDDESAGTPASVVMTPAVVEQIEQQQRWLLTRFVQPEWIDRHLS